MTVEFDVLQNNHTWTLVPYTDDMTLVRNEWVFKVKLNVDGSLKRYKACLVAKGFHQVPRINYFETFPLLLKPSQLELFSHLLSIMDGRCNKSTLTTHSSMGILQSLCICPNKKALLTLPNHLTSANFTRPCMG